MKTMYSKMIVMMMLTLTVYLNNGEVHKYDNAQVWQSQPYEYFWNRVWPVTVRADVDWNTPSASFKNYAKQSDDVKLARIEVHTSDIYLTIADKDTNTALGIYPKDSVLRIEGTE